MSFELRKNHSPGICIVHSYCKGILFDIPFISFFRIIPICSNIYIFQSSIPHIASADEGIAGRIEPIKSIRRTNPRNSMRVAISINHYIKIFLSQKAPAIRANSLVVRLDQIGAALGITFARQLHHLGPLIEGSVTVAICGIIIIAVALNLRIIRLIIVIKNHCADI